MKHKMMRKLLSLVIIAGLLSTIGSGIASAAQNNQVDTSQISSAAAEESLELKCAFPILRDISGKSFEYKVQLAYFGPAPKRFDLSIKAPAKWVATVLREYESIEAPAIELTPDKAIPDIVRVRLSPQTSEYPAPGDYTVTLTVSSGDIIQSIDLTATVTALYRFAFYTEEDRLDTKITAGQSNEVSLVVFNTGTGTIEKIGFTSEKPSGWNITFTPNEVLSLESGKTARVIMSVEPPEKTIAGDYMIKIQAVPAGYLASSLLNISAGHDINLRVTVLAPTIWGWIGIVIVIAVIAGVVIIFRRLGRR